jgi:hypothetical protein
VHEQGSAVSVHLPAEALRVLPDMPEPEPEAEDDGGAEPADPADATDATENPAGQ